MTAERAGRLHPAVKEHRNMAAAGLVVSCAMLLCLEGSHRKLKTNSAASSAIPQEEPPGLDKAPTGLGHVHAADWKFTC